MQTFLPELTFEESAKRLDQKRLGKQRVETLQVMGTLTRLKWDNDLEKVVQREKKGWNHHPAVLMWSGYESALMEYQKAVCNEWTSRGYRDTCLWKTEALLSSSVASKELVMPPWYGQKLVSSHRASLLLKDPEFYSQWKWKETAADDYYWPVSAEDL